VADIDKPFKEVHMSDANTLVHTYIAMWNETDPEQRRELVAQTVTEDASYLDPVMTGEGIDGISAMIAGAQAQFPGHRFRRASGIDAHHGQLRFAWELVAPDGTVALSGIDVGEVASDGRLARISGFFGPLPDSESA